VLVACLMPLKVVAAAVIYLSCRLSLTYSSELFNLFKFMLFFILFIFKKKLF